VQILNWRVTFCMPGHVQVAHLLCARVMGMTLAAQGLQLKHSKCSITISRAKAKGCTGRSTPGLPHQGALPAPHSFPGFASSLRGKALGSRAHSRIRFSQHTCCMPQRSHWLQSCASCSMATQHLHLAWERTPRFGAPPVLHSLLRPPAC
jgi:hypothetical protein